MNPRPPSSSLPAPRFWSRACLVAAVAAAAGAAPALFARAKGDTLVVSHVYNGYTRTKLPGGGFQPETYVFAPGGLVEEVPVLGDSLTTVGFARVAHTVARALESQNYVLSADPARTDEMIMLWYGDTIDTTAKPTGWRLDEFRNARILGFQRDRSRADSLSFAGFAHDFYEEFRAGRYFVVLKAYDFRVARTEKRLKLLWETRFSLRRETVDFVTELPEMARFASLAFGRETGGILVPDSREGRVKLGELKILGPAEP